MPRAASVRAATIRSRSALVTPATFTWRTATSGESRSQPKYPIASAPAAAIARSARVRQEPLETVRQKPLETVRQKPFETVRREPIEMAGSRAGSRSAPTRGVRRDVRAGPRRLLLVATGRAPARAPARLLPAAVAADVLTRV